MLDIWYNKTKRCAIYESNSISANHMHFKNSVADGYYVLKNYHRWEVFIVNMEKITIVFVFCLKVTLTLTLQIN